MLSVVINLYRVCWFVFPHNISKANAARITIHHIGIFHRYSWKAIYFGVKRSEVKVTWHKDTSVSVFRRCTLLMFAARFSQHHICIADAADRRFFCLWSFSQSALAWVMAVLRVLASSRLVGDSLKLCYILLKTSSVYGS